MTGAVNAMQASRLLLALAPLALFGLAVMAAAMALPTTLSLGLRNMAAGLPAGLGLPATAAALPLRHGSPSLPYLTDMVHFFSLRTRRPAVRKPPLLPNGTGGGGTCGFLAAEIATEGEDGRARLLPCWVRPVPPFLTCGGVRLWPNGFTCLSLGV